MRQRAVRSGAVAKKTVQIVVRIEAEMDERLRAYVARLRTETGLEISAGEATRKLLALGLDAVEKSAKRKG